MEQYIQCGDIAENPLYVKELGIHIYTAEEFCYYIFNNTYLLGEDFIRQAVSYTHPTLPTTCDV